MKQAADEAFCSVATDIAADHSLAHPLFVSTAARNWHWVAPKWWWMTNPMDGFMKRTVACATASGASGDHWIRLCFIPAATLGRPVGEGKGAATVSGALRRIVERNLSQPTDVALINSGVHFLGRNDACATVLFCSGDEALKVSATGLSRASLTRMCT